MKKLTFILSLIFAPCLLAAQQKGKPLPLIIKGRITNCPEKQLRIFFKDANQQLSIDTMKLDKDGNFYLKTYKIKGPQQTSIQQNNIQINDIYVAPGYDLTITGDGNDFMTLLKTTKISGIGAESNRFRALMDSIVIARNDRTEYDNLKEVELLTYIKAQKHLKDSVADIVFGRANALITPTAIGSKKGLTDKVDLDLTTGPDKYLTYFGKMTRFDTEFLSIYMLMLHTNLHKWDEARSWAYVKNNANPIILNNMFRPEYMRSEHYTSLMGSEYLKLILRLDRLKDSTLNNKMYSYKKVNTTYKGAIRAQVLYYKIDYGVDDVKSIEELDEHRKRTNEYLVTLTPQMQKSINKHVAEKEAELIKTQVGKPAPKFSLVSNTGKTFSIDDFKGKVIYLDMWASWCGPCREETPAFRTLYSKYKNDDRIAFISIAVHDGINEWKKAIAEDKPEWLQLLDKDGKVSKNYAANMIPKFVVVDKQGNIVSFDASRPSDGKQTEDMLLAEMVK